MAGKYTILFQFTGLTITASYDTEKDRDDVFDILCGHIDLDSSFFAVDGQTIVNLREVLCIAKGKDEAWKSVAEH